jgi:hypothetical protein
VRFTVREVCSAQPNSKRFDMLARKNGDRSASVTQFGIAIIQVCPSSKELLLRIGAPEGSPTVCPTKDYFSYLLCLSATRFLLRLCGLPEINKSTLVG